ncbi:hypothetical protein ABIC08_007703 [Bradyrhizobium sp. RT9b]|uniref:hypothetical protein n=1 Tax=unclassified Bradyrhizobium TaxID=2631580 RepID=UPI00339936E3
MPAFMRASEPAAYVEPAPNIPDVVRNELATLFVDGSSPRNIAVTDARRDPRSQQWTACLKADVNSVTGSSLGPQAYLIVVSGNRIVDRRRIDLDGQCSLGPFKPI